MRKIKPSVSGPEKFGIADPAVMRIIQSMPNADRCVNYKRKVYR